MNDEAKVTSPISITSEEFGKLRAIMRHLLWGRHTEMALWLEIVESIENRHGKQPFDRRN